MAIYLTSPIRLQPAPPLRAQVQLEGSTWAGISKAKLAAEMFDIAKARGFMPGICKADANAYVAKVTAKVNAIAEARATAPVGISKTEVDAFVVKVMAEVDAIAEARAPAPVGISKEEADAFVVNVAAEVNAIAEAREARNTPPAGEQVASCGRATVARRTRHIALTFQQTD